MNIFKEIGKLVYRITHPKKMGTLSIREALSNRKERIVNDKDFEKLNDFNEKFILDEDLIEEDLDDEFDDEFDDEMELENKKSKFSFRKFFSKKLSKQEKQKIIADEDFETLVNYKKQQENEEEILEDSVEDLESNTKEKVKNNDNIYSLVCDYLTNTDIDYIKTEKLFSNIDKIVELGKEDELREFISDSKTVRPELRYNVLIEKMDRIINGNKKSIDNDDTVIDFETLRREKSESKKEETKNEEPTIQVVGAFGDSQKDIVKPENNVKKHIKVEDHELYKKAYEEGKLSAKEYDQILTEIASQLKAELDASMKKQETTKVEPTKEATKAVQKETVKPVQKETTTCTKDVKPSLTKEEADKLYEEKCQKEYNLYQERMTEILKLNDRLSELKSKLNELGAGTFGSDYAEVLENRAKLLKEIKEIELSIDALSNRIVVLEKRGYAREYEEKLRFEEENYAKMYENLLFEQEQEELRKKNLKSNSYILNAFSDEELEKMYSTDFYKDADKLEAVMEYKNIMKM